MSLKVKKLDIEGMLLLETVRHDDDRGFFSEIFRASQLQAAGIPASFPQDNLSRSARNVLRGIHYQLNPKAQGKLMRVLRGAVFDVAVDLRRNSPSFGRWAGMEMRAGDMKALWVPPGFGHGFLALEDNTDVLYKVTQERDPELERGISWSDPDLGIRWPVGNPVLSKRDADLPPFRQAELNFVFQGEWEP